MEYRRRDHGGPVLGASGRAGRARAENRAVRFRTAKSARSAPGTAGQHTTYCWHVMPLNPELGDKSYENFKEEFSDRIIECFARYCPNMTSKNILGRYVYTGREYIQELINMRCGDIFMGAFNAEQVMYNH